MLPNSGDYITQNICYHGSFTCYPIHSLYIKHIYKYSLCTGKTLPSYRESKNQHAKISCFHPSISHIHPSVDRSNPTEYMYQIYTYIQRDYIISLLKGYSTWDMTVHIFHLTVSLRFPKQTFVWGGKRSDGDYVASLTQIHLSSARFTSESTRSI